MRGVFLNNLVFKLSAVFLALTIWFYFFAARENVSFRKGATATFTVPIQVLDSAYSANRVIVSPDSVEIIVKGQREALADMSPDDFRVFVEIRGLRRGEYLLPTRVHLSRPAEVISRNPRNASVTIEERWTPGRRD